MPHSRGVFPVHATVTLALRLNHQTILIFSGGGESKSLQKRREEKEVSYERDTKIINAATFTIEREDHTIGNILRMQLHGDENVLFAGYKLPHPLQYKILVRVSLFLCWIGLNAINFLDFIECIPVPVVFGF
ncbi:hypothetical protein Goarm_010806 [Gossypium armourianum]|uniref:DNA-directed RNA polymerase RBP11-like dimerisation domain-containing protein n=1 Tax=Gossypium armourianum TaxID=34283 RepID=A0A7J9IUX6_9ROSI|nr:hypothetical protein [Gossypium armourianum]